MGRRKTQQPIIVVAGALLLGLIAFCCGGPVALVSSFKSPALPVTQKRSAPRAKQIARTESAPAVPAVQPSFQSQPKQAAWHYKKYSTDTGLAAAETHAKDKRIGLWSDARPIAPWDFRKGVEDNPVATAPSEPSFVPLTPANEPGSITVYVTKSGDKYHLGGCRYLSKSRIAISLDRARAGYSRCSVCKPP